jgi:hypothetical protein
MNNATVDLEARVAALELRVRRSRLIGAVASMLCVVFGATAFFRPLEVPDVIRTRQLIIEDIKGRDRVILGAPIREKMHRISPATGMVIRDTLGHERIGIDLDATGKMGLGMDAGGGCEGKLNPCNPERINLVVNEDGSSFLRFLDRNTTPGALMYLDRDNHVYLEFMKATSSNDVKGRRLGLLGDTTLSGLAAVPQDFRDR